MLLSERSKMDRRSRRRVSEQDNLLGGRTRGDDSRSARPQSTQQDSGKGQGPAKIDMQSATEGFSSRCSMWSVSGVPTAPSSRRRDEAR